MTRRRLVEHLRARGCASLCEGKGHSIYANLQTRAQSSVPRHREIGNNLADKICRDLDVPPVTR